MRRRFMATGVLSLAIGVAHSQEAAPPAEESADELQEVVVTAARRLQSVQTSSLAIAVIGGESLAEAGATQATDLGTVWTGTAGYDRVFDLPAGSVRPARMGSA